MREVTLRGTDIRTTALGFGTASLMGKLTQSESLHLLEVAYEHGIRHFDTAPPYGYGESEAVLGAFLRKRSDATITTKFGLSRPRASSFLFNRAKQLVRPILRASPLLRTKARRAVHAGARVVADFDAGAAADSLAASLKHLGRSHVDILLLHECRASDLQDDRLLHFLTIARDQGQIRAFGIGTDISTIKYCVESAQAYGTVVQFANNANEPNLEDLPFLAKRACITHSPFGGVGKAAPATSKSALDYATTHNPNGIILFSSQSPKRIVDNIRAFV